MVKKAILLILSILFLAQLVLAVPVEIKVKTLPYSNVIVTLSADTTTLDRFKGQSNYFGEISFKSSLDTSKFDMYVQINAASGEELYFKKYLGIDSSDIPSIDLYPDDYQFPDASGLTGNAVKAVENETNASVAPAPAASPEPAANNAKSSFLSGFNISFSANTLYYIIGIVVLLVLIFVIVKLARRKRDPYYYPEPRHEEVRVRKMSEVAPEDGKDFAKAEKRLRDAEAELDRLKNRDKISDMQKKMDDLQREMRRLRG